MIVDSETNKIFLSGCLPKLQPVFFIHFKQLLNECFIEPELLDNTKDIWAVDFMPIQINKDNFIQFQYSPDYLNRFKLEDTITNTNMVPQSKRFKPEKNKLKVEGGNVIKGRKKVIMCDKVLKDNIAWNKSQTKIIDELLNAFKVEEVIFIPTHPEDFIGHADGMIRFIDDDTVIINDLEIEYKYFKNDFISVLKNNKLDYLEIPYNISKAKSEWDASGIYINYLQMKDIIFVPQYDFKEDDLAAKTISDIFPKSKVVPVLCNLIAEEGGVLNCISWNIKVKY